ncbi:MAG: GNAT family N-acetyltransferase [Streptosporangiales bacterium]|nr:GNAT family N-acetyltransferase [Streptosporangiales bacterium]
MSLDAVRLRPVLEPDLEMFDRFALDPELSGEFEWHGWHDPGALRREWAQNGLLGGDGGRLMVVRDDERLGFVGWRKFLVVRESFCWNIGIRLLPEARGHGVGTRAQRLLVRYLFLHSQVMRIEADTEAENHAEQRALEKAGFTREGVIRAGAFRGGRWRDGVVYSILRTEVDLDSPEP